MQNLNIRTIEHKGVKVTIRINYDKGTASLMESVDGAWKPKKWIFSERGLEYMNGWQNVLEAMQVAVAECKKELEKDLAEKTAFKEDFIMKIAKERLNTPSCSCGSSENPHRCFGLIPVKRKK